MTLTPDLSGGFNGSRPSELARLTGHVLLEFVPSFLYTPPRSASVLSPIAFQEFDAQKYREFVRTLSDEALP
jgi:hypothetical protein